MNSRERIIAAMNHKEPDRVPIWFGTAATGAVEKTYENMGDYIGIQFWKQVTSFFDTFKMDERLLKRLHVDVRAVTLGAAGGRNWYPEKIYPDGTFTNIYNIRFKKCGYFSSAIVENPLHNARTVEDIKTYDKWPDSKAIALEASKGLEDEAKYLKNETEYAVLGDILWSHIELSQWIRGLDQWLIDVVKRPEMIEELLQKLWDYQTPIYEEYLKTVGKYTDIIFIGDDLGAQDRLQLRPQQFRELLKPWLKKRIQFIKDRADNVKVLLHSCGSIYEIIPDLIEIGLDGLNPVQPFAANMTRKIKIRIRG